MLSRQEGIKKTAGACVCVCVSACAHTLGHYVEGWFCSREKKKLKMQKGQSEERIWRKKCRDADADSMSKEARG